MLLCDTIDSSIQAVQEKADAQMQKKSMDDFITALAKFDKVLPQLKTTLDCIVELEASEILNSPALSGAIRDDILSAVDTCSGELNGDGLDINSVRLLESSVKAASMELNREWVDSASKYSEGARGYLSMIASLTDNPRQARELCQNIADTSAKPLVSLQQVSKLIALVKEAQSIAAAFSLNPAVEAFLSAVSAGRAAVSDLTPEVQDWLREKQLMNRLRITF